MSTESCVSSGDKQLINTLTKTLVHKIWQYYFPKYFSKGQRLVAELYPIEFTKN